MSPASKSKSKSKEKHSPKAAKEQQKASLKSSGSANTGNGSPTSAYNPVSGTFHSIDTVPTTPPSPLHGNGRFRNIDETEEHSGSSHGTAEYDSLSNNGSCSGESEDHKEKAGSTTPRPETIPGSDNDKREKIRQKNERKHQRQRERRAQELHDRCSGYLVSRKLEMLSQQLVAMGFSSERATLALMLNEGRIQESVNWLFEGSEEEAQKKDIGNGANLKLDISEELAQIMALEIRYKRSKQEVERAVVACEGDLQKAEETLRNQKPEPPVTPPKTEETPNVKNSTRVQEKPASAKTTQLSRNEINYTKGASSLSTLQEPGSRNLQSAKTSQTKSLAEKRWPTTTGSSSSSLAYSMASPIQVVPSSKMMSVSGNEGRTIQQGSIREPVIMIQRPQSLNIKQNSVTNISSTSPGTNGWYANNVLGSESMKLSSKLLQNQNRGSYSAESYNSPQHFHPQAQINKPLSPENFPSRYTQHAYMSSSGLGLGSVDPALARLGGSWTTMGGVASSPSLTVPSSLGLFSGWGTTGSSGHVDWNARDMMSNCDYNSIDWTLELNTSPSKPTGLMLGLSSMRIACTNGIRFDGGMGTETSAPTGGPREWTSPFAGKDIFSVPRQFVTSPSP